MSGWLLRSEAQQTYLCEFIHAGVHPLKPRHLIACGILHVHGPPLRRSRGCAGHENGFHVPEIATSSETQPAALLPSRCDVKSTRARRRR